jgi:ATP-binding protein involved in chromosome partitioning
VKNYYDIVGDGGSRVLEQVAEQRTRITDGLAGVRHLVAVGSGKGGVGKSTLTLHLAGALRARGLRIAILDADFNGPSQARMAGVQGALFVPPPLPTGSGVASGSPRVALPRTTNGIGVFSMGSMIPESESLEFESAAHGESHTWRATREFALLGEILGAFEWGALDLLMFDLPPGAERTVQYADFLGPRTSFLLVTIPSAVARGVVARSVAALSKGPNRVLGYVENMSGYYCHDCNAIKPLFLSSDPSGLEIPCLGTVPFDPELARHCDTGMPLAELPDTPVPTHRADKRAAGTPAATPPHTVRAAGTPASTPPHTVRAAGTPVGRALDHVAQQLLDSLESNRPRARP